MESISSPESARKACVVEGADVGAHKYAPGTSEERRLLAHELAYVVQQDIT
jgi:hypothetical protein